MTAYSRHLRNGEPIDTTCQAMLQNIFDRAAQHSPFFTAREE